MIIAKGNYTTARIMIDEVEPSCMAQINSFVNHPAFTNPVAIMPDTHAGKGSVIGFTMPLTSKIVPNVVGVDIGCGMLSVNIGKDLPLPLETLDRKIRGRIPFGHEVHEKAVVHMRDEFPWHTVSALAEKFAMRYRERFGAGLQIAEYSERWFLKKCEEIRGNARRFINSLGTLGGGNHFIETGVSTANDYWITVHSGSRNLGKRVCEYWQGRAEKRVRTLLKVTLREEIARIRAEYQGSDIERKIFEMRESYGLNAAGHKGLEWLEGEPMGGYLADMLFSQVYAAVNRRTMMRIITEILGTEPLETIETVHNYIDFNDFVIRKGAIRSYENERMIIPFNMRDGVRICTGKSNAEWNCSAPHGAGRLMSRSEARKRLQVDAFKRQMSGIYSSSVGFSTLDESPNAYKPAHEIEKAIAPTAVIIERVKPLHNMKDGSGDGGD